MTTPNLSDEGLERLIQDLFPVMTRDKKLNQVSIEEGEQK